MVDSFRVGQRLFLTVMNEKASPMYTSDFLCRLFEQESQGLFDAREVVLGQTQQGGTPTPVRPHPGHPVGRALHRLAQQPDRHQEVRQRASSGCTRAGSRILPLRQAEDLADWDHRRPIDQWWMQLRPIIDVLAGRLAVTPVVPG